MHKYFEIEYARKVNSIFCLVYLLPIMVLIISTYSNKVNFTAKVMEIRYFGRHHTSVTEIKLDNNETIEFEFMYNFFDQQKFLNIKKGDELFYSKTNETVVEIENRGSNHKLGVVYFILTDYLGCLMIIYLLMYYYNFITYNNCGPYFVSNCKNKSQKNKEKINNWSKKHPILTFLFLGIVIYLLFSLGQLIKYNQPHFETYFLYKYIVLYFPFFLSFFLFFYLIKESN